MFFLNGASQCMNGSTAQSWLKIRNNMAVILQTTFANPFRWMIAIVSLSKFHKFVPRGQINNISAYLIGTMAFSKPIMSYFIDVSLGCEWGTTSVYFGITYVCFIPSRLPVFAVEPQYLLQDFLFLSKVSFEGHIQNLQKISCWLKIWMGFVGPILIKLWTSSIWGFL